MPMYEAIEAAAESVVGTNIMQGNRGETKWYPRIIRWIAVIGSTAAGDAAVDLIIGDTFKGRYRLTATGSSIQRNRDQQDCNVLVPPFIPIRIEIADVGATNVIYVFMDIVP